jgi:hypothetical protein
MQAVSVEGDGLAVSRQAAGMRDAHPWQGQVAGRTNRAGRAVAADDVGLARPDGEAVSRCIGSEVGAGIPQCIRRHRDSAQGARIQTPGLADVGQLAGADRAPLAEDVCQCNVGDPSGIPRGIARDASDRGMERWRLVGLAECQSQYGHHDDSRGCDEADSARRHRGCVADSSLRCTGHGQESG